MPRCQGVTLKDTRCKRNAKKGDLYCSQHTNQTKTTIVGLPDERSTLPRKCETSIKNGPTKKDTPGHIYVYSLLRDERESHSYWKIGRTTQTVEKRLKQWHGSILKASYKVKYNKLAEKLIHQVLADVRIYRYEYIKGRDGTARRYHSVWKSSGEPLMDTQNRAKDIKDGNFKLAALDKHVEWFVCDWKTTKQVIEAIVDYVNQL